jgi:hypothetical protein
LPVKIFKHRLWAPRRVCLGSPPMFRFASKADVGPSCIGRTAR